jgi:hypothetical protein
MNKFERLIEYILNEQEQKARELFHEIVVERSRNIYEDLMASEEIGGSPVDSMVDEIEADEQGIESDMVDMDSDMEDMGDVEADADSGDADMEDRVMDLEDALDELKAEFDKLMSQEDDAEADADAESDQEDLDSDESDMDADEAEDEDDSEEVKAMETMHDDQDADAELAELREYIEKVAQPKGEDHKAKSPVAGKNDMGGSAKNIAQGGDVASTSKPKVGDMGAVDPRTAAKTAFGKKAPAASDSDVKSTSPVGSK